MLHTLNGSEGISVAIAINGRPNPIKGDEYVLVRNTEHKDPLWKNPYGMIQKNEDSEHAIERALVKKTGLFSHHTEFILRYQTFDHPFYVYLCIIDGFEGLYKEPVRIGASVYEAKTFTYPEILAMAHQTKHGKMLPIQLKMFKLAHEKLQRINEQILRQQTVVAA